MNRAFVDSNHDDAEGDEVIVADGLQVSYGYVRVLRSVDLKVKRGEFWMIFGPNGAGKSTLMGVLATLIKPQGGRLTIEGVSAARPGADLRRKIGLVSHQSFLYADLTARENLLFYGRLYGLRSPAEAVERALGEVGLDLCADRRLRTFSRGMHQRLAIARALLPDPHILLLDEPFSGLDQQARGRFRSLLNDMHERRKTFVLATHDVRLGLELCSHVALLDRGRIVRSGGRDELTEADFSAFCRRGRNVGS